MITIGRTDRIFENKCEDLDIVPISTVQPKI